MSNLIFLLPFMSTTLLLFSYNTHQFFNLFLILNTLKLCSSLWIAPVIVDFISSCWCCCKWHLEYISICPSQLYSRFQWFPRTINVFLNSLCLSGILCHHLMHQYWHSICLDSVDYWNPLRIFNPYLAPYDVQHIVIINPLHILIVLDWVIKALSIS